MSALKKVLSRGIIGSDLFLKDHFGNSFDDVLNEKLRKGVALRL